MMYIHVYILVCRTHNKNNTSPTLIQYARCLTSPPAICFTYMTGGFTYMAGGTGETYVKFFLTPTVTPNGLI